MKDYVLGIDLATGQTGITRCKIKDIKNQKQINKYVESKCLSITNTKLTKEPKMVNFLYQSFLGDRILEKWIKGASLVIVEKPYNVKGHGLVLIELLGMVKLFCIKYGVNYHEVAQTTLKKFATDNGKAEKSEMVKRALKEFKFEADTEDEIDAFWCCMFGMTSLNKLHGKFVTKFRKDSIKKGNYVDVVKIKEEVL